MIHEISEYIRDPSGAALFAGAVVMLYLHLRIQMNNEPKKELSFYAKPAALVAMLVYFIVANGVSSRESISKEPF